MSITEIVIWTIRGLVVVAFLLFGARELVELFRKHDRRMGRGWWRVWAVGRTTLREAWAGRVWLLPVLWFGAGMLLVMATRPFDESERIPLYIKALLSSQEVLVMVMMWVMACVSLPRERERKILVTNASKPLSRLEILLGKIVGLSLAAGVSLMVMFGATVVILEVADWRMRVRAQSAYEVQVKDFGKNYEAPSEALKQLSEEGSLHAYNFVKVPKRGMNLGMLRFGKAQDEWQLTRFVIGGTREKAIYTFRMLDVHEVTMLREPGRRPFFVFYFPWEIPTPVRAAGMKPPEKVEIRVVAYASGTSARQEKVLTLNDQMAAVWEPDQPEALYSTMATPWTLTRNRGPVTVEVTCVTPGVVLQVLEGADPDADGNVPADAEFNLEFGNRQEELQMGLPPQARLPRARPVVMGAERRERQEIAAPSVKQPVSEMGIFRFAGSDLGNVPVDENGNFKLALQLETYKSDNTQLPTKVGVQIRSLDNPGEVFDKRDIEVREKRVMEVEVPAKFLGRADGKQREDMLVALHCTTGGHLVTVVEDSVRIALPATPFMMNLLKSEAVIFLETVLLIALSVACSVRLGWPVAMFCSGVCFLFGLFTMWINGLQEYGGLEALNIRVTAESSPLVHFLDQSFDVLWVVLGFISILVPDFTKFQPLGYIEKLQNIPWQVLAGNMVDMAAFTIPFVALAYLMFRKQELG